MRGRTVALLVTVAVALAGLLALGGVGAAGTAKPRIVYVCDDYYAPKACDGQEVGSARVHKRGKVRWKWTPVFNAHNVKLTKAPHGVKKSKFRSQTSSSPTYTFTKRFKKPGRYHFICTIHPAVMQMDVKVRR